MGTPASAGTPRPVDLLIRHGRVITMDADRRVLADGSVAIQDGRIVAVGPDRELAAAGWSGRQERDARGGIVHPGLIDGHAHTNSEAIRGFAPKTHADWSRVEATFYGAITPDDEHVGALLSTMEMVASGTTLYCDTGSSTDLAATATAIEAVGLRGIPGLFIGDASEDPVVKPLTHPAARCVELLEEQLERYPFRGSRHARCAVTMEGMGLCSDELLVAGADLARRRGVPMVMHQSWSAGEVAASIAATGRRPVEHLADLGILGPHLTLVHMIALGPSEVELVRTTGTNLVHCPSASMRRGMGAIRNGRFPELAAAGVHVGLGSDGFSGKRDVLRQVYLAAIAYRELRADLPVLTGEAALELATITGAAALGLADELGSLEPGKAADLVIHTVDRPEAHPRFGDPVDNLVFFAGAATVDTVIVAGETIYDGGRFTRVDAADVYRRVDAKAAAFESTIGTGAYSLWPLVE
jgi:cytosine/adenosine deaminase-related metal-dependent hydrolase